jgi:hypothetical protein
MHRRSLFKTISLLTAASFVGEAQWLAACSSKKNTKEALFNAQDIALLDQIAETILPKTIENGIIIPGAAMANVGAFMAHFISHCYSPAQQATVLLGLEQLNKQCEKIGQQGFLQITGQQKTQVLEKIAIEAKSHQSTQPNTSHYFTMLMQLSLFGFFTSAPGATQVLRYNPVPGPYLGCIPYNSGDVVWG